MNSGAVERKFEGEIEAWLLKHGGYAKGDPHAFDRELGLDPSEVFAFVEETQPDAYRELSARHGGDEAARTTFLRRLAAEIDERGTVDVLRHGVKDLGVEIRLAFFKPAHGLTPELMSRYEANRLILVRQLPTRRRTEHVDLALLLNGIPVATAELKNPLTNQDIEHAIRAVSILTATRRTCRSARRAVVHFAVDPDLVAMTTRLAGPRDAVPSVQPRLRRGRRGQPAEPERPQDCLPVGAGLAARQLARPARALRPGRKPADGVERRRSARRRR